MAVIWTLGKTSNYWASGKEFPEVIIRTENLISAAVEEWLVKQLPNLRIMAWAMLALSATGGASVQPFQGALSVVSGSMCDQNSNCLQIFSLDNWTEETGPIWHCHQWEKNLPKIARKSIRSLLQKRKVNWKSCLCWFKRRNSGSFDGARDRILMKKSSDKLLKVSIYFAAREKSEIPMKKCKRNSSSKGNDRLTWTNNCCIGISSNNGTPFCYVFYGCIMLT